MESILGDQVRILDILPDDKGTTIRCQLRVVSLADDPIYEALSYVWGSPHHVWDGAYVDQSKANLVSIEISNRRQEVTSNLYAALTRLRSSSKNRPVWIDQLCINQNDYEEKSTQVQLMRKIYSKCTRGLIWLGEIRDDIPENDAATVVEYLVYINALLHSDGSSHLALPNFTRSRPDFERFLKALRSIHRYQCTWWTRIWTLQEAVLPRKADIFWGPFIIPWNTFLDAARFFTFKSFLELDIASGLGKHEQWVMFDIFRYVKALADARYRVHAGGVHMQLDPMHILSRWRGRLASDPRDKIYALSSLYDNKTLPSSGKCDYSLTVQEVFESVTMDLIQLYGDLRPLSMCPRVLCKYATPGIPGWVIDLGSERGYFGPWTTDYRLYDITCRGL
ncbi:heterokaryon incompatibility protein-domain-containing protein [Truncatella angustata]|uniref:Heterokaryon incompatibility protein-domain-containing protein n=1 Tax=Truncatella angustata TaxID=152316 RepID=A0A9P9A3R4_9PEZI|nr:heterokaryon incompatibility protein-domain-containing protein [Truncatella angustata]KAH6659179.1 heterokaryon incompatibility protein-domain-containing protein [Truncatella angustata]